MPHWGFTLGIAATCPLPFLPICIGLVLTPTTHHLPHPSFMVEVVVLREVCLDVYVMIEPTFSRRCYLCSQDEFHRICRHLSYGPDCGARRRRKIILWIKKKREGRMSTSSGSRTSAEQNTKTEHTLHSLSTWLRIRQLQSFSSQLSLCRRQAGPRHFTAPRIHSTARSSRHPPPPYSPQRARKAPKLKNTLSLYTGDDIT